MIRSSAKKQKLPPPVHKEETLPREVQEISVDFPGKLRITSGMPGNETVYEIGAIGSDGLRLIKRANDPSFKGVLVGSGEIGEKTLTFNILDPTSVKVGWSMATALDKSASKTKTGSREVTKIEIL